MLTLAFIRQARAFGLRGEKGTNWGMFVVVVAED